MLVMVKSQRHSRKWGDQRKAWPRRERADHQDQQSHRQVEQTANRRVAGPGG